MSSKGKYFDGAIKIKKKRFSHTFDDSGPSGSAGPDGRASMTVTGRVTKASVTGTVDFHEETYAYAGQPHTYTCDSGVLTWTASRGGVYPTPKPA
ncbi:MAG: hypothetical protein QOC97_386, partial [Chloroflexota bacterium]|jgi:hypothetical protein|nr:hypothetical protein [Chloroflexota bacterium]